jgi:hypothetical protein
MPTDDAEDPDAGGPDDTLDPFESLDSDWVRNNDGDDVVEPPESWIAADRVGEDESLDERLAEEEPEPSVDGPFTDQLPLEEVPLTDESLVDDGIPPAEHAVKHADIVERVIVEESSVDRPQVDGTPEDGDSFFPIVK